MAKEGKWTKDLESQTAKIPSLVFLGVAMGILGTALVMKMIGRGQTGLIIGQWAAPVLLMGLYDKVVKTEGHD